MSPPLERRRRTGPPPLTRPARLLRPMPPWSIVIVSPDTSTWPPLVDASRWNPTSLPTLALTCPPDVEREQSPFRPPSKPALTSPPLVSALRVLSTESTLMSLPEVLRSEAPMRCLADTFPPDVESLTLERPSTMTTLPPDV